MKNKSVVESELEMPVTVPMDPMFNDNPVFSFNPYGGDNDIDIEDPEDITNIEEEEEETPPAPSTQTQTDEVDDDDAGNEDEDEEDESPLSLVASFLKEEQLVDEIPAEITPDSFKELWQQSLDKAIEEELSDLPDETKELIEFVRKGGKQSDFLAAAATVVQYEQMDLSEERNQKIVVTEYLKSMGYDDEEIEDQINMLIDTDRLESRAEKYVDKLIEKQSKQKQQLIIAQQQEIEAKKKAYNEYVDTLKTTIDESQDIAGMDISKEDKIKFREYMLKPVNKEGMTQYALDLKSASMKDLIALAYFKYKKFDFKDIKKKVETKRVSITRQKLEDKVSSKKPKNNGGLDLSGLKFIHGK